MTDTYGQMPPMPGPMAAPMPGPMPEPTFTLRIRRTKTKGTLRVCTVPPEEFLIARDATSEDDAAIIGHRREMTVSDLVAMGYDYDTVINNLDQGWSEENNEKQIRNPALADPSRFSADPAMRKTKYVEALIRIDRDGDGIAELLKVCAMSDVSKILHIEPASDVNFAIWSPNPEPHMAVGKSVADETMDLQRIKTNLMRFTLDGLAQAIVPRTAYDYTSVNQDDMVSNEVGAAVRTQGSPQDKIMPLATPFPAGDALAMLQYLDEVKASRTGISKASQGLDPDVLQGTTATAVNATVSAAEMRQEVIARFFAEALKRTFRGMLKTVKRHQDQARMVRLRNKFVNVDPRPWNVDMDLKVNVAIGTNNRQDKYAMYGQVAQKQQELLMGLGPDNELCDISQLRNTFAKMLELAGESDVTQFFKEVPPEAVAQLKAKDEQSKAGKTDPADQLAKAEMAKAQANMLEAQNKPKIEAAKALAQDDLDRDKLDSDVILKAVDMGLKYGFEPSAIVQFCFAAMARKRDQQPMPQLFAMAAMAQPPQADQGQGGPPGPPNGGMPPQGGPAGPPPQSMNGGGMGA